MPVRSVDVPLFKCRCHRQNDISVLNGFVEELVGADHHLQLGECFFHLVSVEILGERVLTGDPQHAHRRLVGIQNAFGGFVDIQ